MLLKMASMFGLQQTLKTCDAIFYTDERNATQRRRYEKLQPVSLQINLRRFVAIRSQSILI
jgi:hypothetical protein